MYALSISEECHFIRNDYSQYIDRRLLKVCLVKIKIRQKISSDKFNFKVSMRKVWTVFPVS